MFNALELDFHPVGENSKSGDAISLRFGNYDNGRWTEQYVIVIDGGNKDSAEKVIKHIREVYNTDVVDWAILTHPDGDHASGLRYIVNELNVKNLWMHRPWRHWTDLKDSIKDGRITKTSFNDRMKNAYQFAYDLEKIASARGTKICAPQQGKVLQSNGVNLLQVLGPGKDFYLSLIQASEKTPDMHLTEAFAKSFSSGKKKTVYEDMRMETGHLEDMEDATSPENDMSTVLYITIANTKILLTGDAGTSGLYKAIYYAMLEKISLKNLNVFQVPHHGSRHNLSRGILEYIHADSAYISCAVNGEPDHPAKVVTNELQRHNIPPYVTKGKIICHRTANLPVRPGYGPITSVPFYNYVEVPDSD